MAKHYLIAASIIAFVIVTVAAFSLVTDALLQRQILASIEESAESRAETWKERLFRALPSAGELIRSGFGSEEHLQRLHDPLVLGDILHFEFFNADGKRTFSSRSSTFDMGEALAAQENESHKHSFAKAVATGKPVTTIFHEHAYQSSIERYHAISETYLPVVAADGEVIGVIELYLDMGHFLETLEGAFQFVGTITSIGTLIVVLLPVAAFGLRTRQVLLADRKLLELTRFDQLTGTLNRNSLSEFMETYFSSHDDPSGLGILFVDIDHFKQLNDRFGHAYGDQVLQHIASALMKSLRGSSDLVGRYGGDEFIVLCPNTTIAELRKVHQRLAAAIAARLEKDDIDHTISVSVGAYVTTRSDTERLALHAADTALYEAKRRGRNQTVEYAPDMEVAK